MERRFSRPLNPAIKGHLLIKLFRVRKEVEEEIRKIRSEIQNPIDFHRIPNHPAEIAQNHGVNGSRLTLLHDRLKKVDEVIKKIEKGWDGLCERCREPVTLRRLKAVSFMTVHCANCANELEKRKK